MYDYPTPDPAWDYSAVWHLLQSSKAELDTLFSYMATVEDATEESDREIKQCLNEIGQQLNHARRMMGEGF